MTANPDSALRQALAALAPFAQKIRGIESAWSTPWPISDAQPTVVNYGDLRRAREAHALITEALAQSQDKP